MAQTRLCDGHCPKEYIKPSSTCECRVCKIKFHLPCYDIIGTTERVFVTKNVVFICDECLITIDNIESSPKRKAANNSKAGKNNNQTKLSQNSNGSIEILSEKNTHIVSNFSNVSNLSKISNLINELKKQIDINTEQLNVNTTSVTELKQSIVSVHSTVNKLNTNVTTIRNKNDNQFAGGKVPSQRTFASVISQCNVTQSQLNAQQQTPKSSLRPKLDADKSVLRAKSDDMKIKVAMKKRVLKAGTGSPADDVLGNGVQLQERIPKMPMKSLYISRIPTEVTTAKMIEYIKRKIPELNDNEVKLNLLVKKDQQIDRLTFVSFRLACVDNLYDKLSEPSFWPRNVLIGEFVERPKQPKIGDFLNFPALGDQKNNTTNNEIIDIADVTPQAVPQNGSNNPLVREHTNANNNDSNNIKNNENRSVEEDSTSQNDPVDLSVEIMESETENDMHQKN